MPSNKVIPNVSELEAKTKISDSAKLFQRRQQAVRRKVREDLIEASGIGGAMRRVNKIVSTSTRGFLGRMDRMFTGNSGSNKPKKL